MISIVIVDDQVLFAESLKNILEMRTRDLKVLGLAYDGRQAIDLVASKRPDIVLMDVRMPKMDGVEAARSILAANPEEKIVMLTTFDDDAYVHEALRHGAVGYLLKTTKPVDLIAAIRAIKQGTVQISQEVARKLVRDGRVHSAHGDQAGTTEAVSASISALSQRERQLLKFLLEGLSNKEIADKLYIAEQTVKNHLSIIYSKLDVKNRSQALALLANVELNLAP